MLITLHDVSVVLHSDWNWQQEDSGCRQVDVMKPGELGIIIAVVTGGYPKKDSKQALVLTPRSNFGWQSVVYFAEVTEAELARRRVRKSFEAR